MVSITYAVPPGRGHTHTLAGLSTFLSGAAKPEEKPDPRGDDPPSQIVHNAEELAALTAEEPKKKEAAAATPSPSAEIDISKLDIRVGVIQKAWEHEEADKLFCEEIDLDTEVRQVASGLRTHYKVDDLVGQRVLVLANLKARKLVGFPSHGMVLCASSADGTVKFVEPPAGAEIGERITVEGFDGEPATENQILKKKMLDAIFPDLQTNEDGIACYKGVPLSTSAGPCLPTLKGASVS